MCSFLRGLSSSWSLFGEMTDHGLIGTAIALPIWPLLPSFFCFRDSKRLCQSRWARGAVVACHQRANLPTGPVLSAPATYALSTSHNDRFSISRIEGGSVYGNFSIDRSAEYCRLGMIVRHGRLLGPLQRRDRIHEFAVSSTPILPFINCTLKLFFTLPFLL